jgi:hypothetical protein
VCGRPRPGGRSICPDGRGICPDGVAAQREECDGECSLQRRRAPALPRAPDGQAQNDGGVQVVSAALQKPPAPPHTPLALAAAMSLVPSADSR